MTDSMILAAADLRGEIGPLNFLPAIAVLGVVLAGFASLLPSRTVAAGAQARAAWRARFVMTTGFNAAVAALGIVALAAFTEDDALVVRLGMLLVLLITLTPLPWALRSLGDRAVFRSRREIGGWLAGEALFRMLALSNVVVGSGALLIAVFALWITGAITVYLNQSAEIYPLAVTPGLPADDSAPS